jgi:hypothetical protein
VKHAEGILLKENSIIERSLKEFKRKFNSILELNNSANESKALSDTDAFLYYDNNKVILTEDQDFKIKALAYSINELLFQINNNTLNQIFLRSTQEKKVMLAKLLTNNFYMTLTAVSWQRIDELKGEKINVLLAKLIIDELSDNKFEKDTADIRKALFENHILLERLYGYIKDDKTMKMVRKLIINNSQ